MSAVLDAALDYAARGWAVLPLRGKLPAGELVPGGFKDASTDPATIEGWFGREEGLNVGIACRGDLAVIDIDPRSDPAGRAPAALLAELLPDGVPSGARVVATGGGGLHVYCAGPASGSKPQPWADLKGDGGYVVAPPSLHESGRLYAVTEEGAATLPPLPAHVAPQPRVAGEWKGRLAGDAIREGGRHVAITRIAGGMLRTLAPEDAQQTILAVNETRCVPPLPDGEVLRIVADLAGKDARRDAAANGRPKLRTLDMGRMLTTPPPPIDWIAEPILARGHVTMLAGREGEGKSMLALALAAAIGRGDGLAGVECAAGRVLVVDAENGEQEVHRRVRGLNVTSGAMVYIEADGFDAATDLAMVEAEATRHQPDVVVLDSLRSLAPAMRENDSDDAEAVLAPLRALTRNHRCAVLLLHHASKAGGYRGSSAIGAAVELGFELGRHPDDPEKRTRRHLANWKMRIAPEMPTMWLTLEAHEGGVLIEKAEPFHPSDATTGREGGLVQRIGVLLASSDAPMQRSEILAALGEDGGGTFQRALGRAVETGLVTHVARGLYAPPEGGSVHVDGQMDRTGGGSVHPSSVPRSMDGWTDENGVAEPVDIRNCRERGHDVRPHPSTGQDVRHKCHPPAASIAGGQK